MSDIAVRGRDVAADHANRTPEMRIPFSPARGRNALWPKRYEAIVSDLSRHEVQSPQEIVRGGLPDLDPVHETVTVAAESGKRCNVATPPVQAKAS
jgi:hypothetical protein